MKKSTLSSAALAMGLALTAVSPSAAKETSAITQRVEIHDLDLTTEKGQKRLERRIDRAARRVCNYRTPVSTRGIYDPIARDCYVAAKVSAFEAMALAVEKEQRGG